MYQNLKKHACWKCNFSTSRKFNLDRHFKRKHQDQHHQFVQAQQARIQQHGGRVQVLHQQHDHADKARQKHEIIRQLKKIKISSNDDELTKETIAKLMTLL
jgi:hypothetical protein